MYDEIVKRLRELHPEEFGNQWDFAFACQQAMHEAADAIELLQKTQQPKWIPVTERLPKERINPNTHDFEYVLCATIWGDVRPVKYGAPIGSKDAHFWNGAGYVDAYITRWMPLPEPPDHIGDANEMVEQ